MTCASTTERDTQRDRHRDPRSGCAPDMMERATAYMVRSMASTTREAGISVTWCARC